MNHPEVTAAHREAAARVLDYYTDQPLADRVALAIAYAERRGAQQPSPPELQALLLRDWAVRVLDAWAEQSDRRYYEVDKMGFDAVGLGVGRQWRCNCFEVVFQPGRDTRKVNLANGLSYEHASAARLSAATAVWPSLPADVQAKIGARP